MMIPAPGRDNARRRIRFGWRPSRRRPGNRQAPARKRARLHDHAAQQGWARIWRGSSWKTTSRPGNLKIINDDVPLGVPANKALYQQLAANPHIGPPWTTRASANRFPTFRRWALLVGDGCSTGGHHEWPAAGADGAECSGG